MFVALTENDAPETTSNVSLSFTITLIFCGISDGVIISSSSFSGNLYNSTTWYAVSPDSTL